MQNHAESSWNYVKKSFLNPNVQHCTTILSLVPLSIGFNINFFTLFSDFNPNIYWGGDNFVFWGPLATTVISGLFVATFLTLFIVPSSFYIVYQLKLTINRWNGVKT